MADSEPIHNLDTAAMALSSIISVWLLTFLSLRSVCCPPLSRFGIQAHPAHIPVESDQSRPFVGKGQPNWSPPPPNGPSIFGYDIVRMTAGAGPPVTLLPRSWIVFVSVFVPRTQFGIPDSHDVMQMRVTGMIR